MDLGWLALVPLESMAMVPHTLAVPPARGSRAPWSRRGAQPASRDNPGHRASDTRIIRLSMHTWEVTPGNKPP